jgi:alpha-L-rhamnosidase
MLVLALSLVLGVSASAGWLNVEELKCEYRINPLGLDTPQPRLSWWLKSDERGQGQTAYQVLAASSAKLLADGKADLWDSGKVTSSDSVHVVYGGKALVAGQRVYWQVRAWDREGQSSFYSDPAWWEMGLLKPEDWQAQWITGPQAAPRTEQQMFEDDPAPLFRKEFVLGKKLQRARVYVSGLGYYELHLNGQRVGDHVLDPGWTTYSRRVLYSTYDVTDQLKQGRNALGVMLGNGWFNPLPLRLWGHINPRDALTVGQPRLILQLVAEFTDGTAQTIVTDGSWKVSDGPILRNSVYLGEVYDARKEQPGWDKAGFDDSCWHRAAAAREGLGPLQAQDAPPIRLTRELKAVKLTEPKPGVYIFDLGQNFAGWIRLRVKGPAGTQVKLRYGELLYPDGALNGMTAVCGQIKGGGPDYRYDGKGAPKTAWQMDEYILRGEPAGKEEVYEQRFTFHGFRYVEVTGYPGKPSLNSLVGLRLNSDVAPAGSFVCSNERLNRIQEMVEWTELSNLFSVESDCPHREKFGYGGDIVAAGEMAMFNFDMGRFYAKAVADLADAARTNGGFTETAPFVGISDAGLGDKSGPVGWGTAHPFLLWQLYQHYGDKRLLEENYEPAKRWLALLRSNARNGILDNGISDHESLAPKPRAVTGTGFYYLNAKLLASIARALGKEEDAGEATALAVTIKAAFNREFLQPGTGRYYTGTQCCQAFALALGLVPDEERNRALRVLVEDVREHQGHLTTGIFGTKFMLQALSDLDQADVAYEMVNQRTFPGWGYMLDQGATTLWEHWEFSDNTYSHNHPMFGSVSEWFFKALAGIQAAPEAVGFDRVVIRPCPVDDLQWVRAEHTCVHGKVTSMWAHAEGKFQLRVSVPVGVQATVFLPSNDGGRITESRQPVERAPGVQLLRRKPGRAVLTIGAGDYEFMSGFAPAR